MGLLGPHSVSCYVFTSFTCIAIAITVLSVKSVASCSFSNMHHFCMPVMLQYCVKESCAEILHRILVKLKKNILQREQKIFIQTF